MSIKTTSWERYSEVATKYAIYAIYLLPLWVGSSFYFPFITPRNFAFRVLVGIALSFFVMLFVTKPKRFRIPRHHILTSFVIMIGWLTLSSFINGDFLHSFWSTYERMEGLSNFYIVLIAMGIFLALFKTEKNWLDLMRFTVFVSFFVAFVAIGQKLDINVLLASGGGERVSSTLGNATYLATYALFHVFFAWYLISKKIQDSFKQEFIFLLIMDTIFVITEARLGVLRATFDHSTLLLLMFIPHLTILLARFSKNESIRKRARVGFYSFVGLVNFIALFNTQTRGALVGLIISLALMLIVLLMFDTRSKKLRQGVLVTLIILVVGISSVFNFKESSVIQENPTLNRISDISISDSTTRSRLLTWEASFKGWKEKPILGWGEENFHIVFNKFFPQQIYRHVGSRVWFDRPHNVFLQPLVHGGIVAFVAYLALFAFALFSLYKYVKLGGDIKGAVILGGLIIAYAIQNMFVFDSFNSYILFILLFGYIIYLTAEQVSYEDEQSKIKKPPIILFAFIIVGTYYLNIPYARANIENVKSIVTLNRSLAAEEGIVEAGQHFVETMNQTFLGKYEIRQTFSEQVASILERRQLPNETALQLAKLAEAEMIKNVDAQPRNVRHHSFLTNLYLNMVYVDKSVLEKNIELLDSAIPLSPTRTHLYYSLGRSYINKQDKDKAIEAFETAVELSPKVYDAHLNMIAAFATFGEDEAALTHIETIAESLERPLTVTEWSRLAEVFQLLKRLPVALTVLDEALVHYPDAPELYKQKAVYHIGNSQREDAMQAADMALELDPSFIEGYNQFIKQIDSL